jgi:hypothetical protein
MKKQVAYKTTDALRDIIMWVGDSITPETATHIKEVLEKLDSHSWAAGYDDAKEDSE